MQVYGICPCIYGLTCRPHGPTWTCRWVVMHEENFIHINRSYMHHVCGSVHSCFCVAVQVGKENVSHRRTKRSPKRINNPCLMMAQLPVSTVPSTCITSWKHFLFSTVAGIDLATPRQVDLGEGFDFAIMDALLEGFDTGVHAWVRTWTVTWGIYIWWQFLNMHIIGWGWLC